MEALTMAPVGEVLSSVLPAGVTPVATGQDNPAMARARADVDAEKRRALMPAAPRVPKHFKAARFATWQPKGPSIEAARGVVQEWVRNVVGGRPSMVALVGPEGTSKSHLLACAAWDLYEAHAIRAEFVEWFVIADELRDLATAREARAALRKPDVLIVDECRPTSGTDFDAMELVKLSMWAYSHDQSVLLATNFASLKELMGGPAADRWGVVTVQGPSAR